MNIFDKLLREYLKEAKAVTLGTGQKFADTSRYDPYKSFKFEVSISGNMTFAKAGFQKVSGLKAKTDVVEYREGADDNTVSKSPGLTKYDPIVLERGMSEDTDMWDFFLKAFNADSKYRASMKIVLRDRVGNAVKTWNIVEAWVSEYDTGDFDAMSNNVMLEKITLQHEGFSKA